MSRGANSMSRWGRKVGAGDLIVDNVGLHLQQVLPILGENHGLLVVGPRESANRVQGFPERDHHELGLSIRRASQNVGAEIAWSGADFRNTRLIEVHLVLVRLGLQGAPFPDSSDGP